MNDVLSGWTQGSFTAAGLTRDTYRRGSGPGVVVVHEIPGITPKVAQFANDVVDAGFTVVMATHANWLLDSYIYGFALQEASLPFDTADELADMAEDVFLPQLSADEFPYLIESATVLFTAGYDPAEEFLFGLDLVLAALEPLRDSR